ncbi:hypothetical protein BGZ51_002164 [Haplosporangium sp. Z 767]|nr:hypothetical protein BGZ51_002164 [Haplosporangium sp. Z 767]
MSKNAFLSKFSHLTRSTVARGTGQSRAWVHRPIISAPMNAWSGPKLVAAVANHGGMPMYPIGYFTNPSTILADLQTIPPLLDDSELQKDDPEDPTATKFLPYGVGFITFWLDRQGPELLLSILKGQGDTPNRRSVARPPAAVWFSFGDYRPYLQLIREHGAPGTRIIVQVQTVQEALDAQRENVDVIVLQGTEAGGHGAQRVSPLMSLLPETAQALQSQMASAASSSTPLAMPALLAAGGISSNTQLTAVQSLGASGAVVGTGFMVTHESPGPQKAKDRLLQTQDGGVNTVRTRVFDELRSFEWPQAYDGRVIRNLVTEREAQDLEEHGLYNPQGEASFKLLREDRAGTKADWNKATLEQDFDLLPIWCGTGVGMLKKSVSVGEFMAQLAD